MSRDELQALARMFEPAQPSLRFMLEILCSDKAELFFLCEICFEFLVDWKKLPHYIAHEKMRL
jgi:hypothetical protein